MASWAAQRAWLLASRASHRSSTSAQALLLALARDCWWLARWGLLAEATSVIDWGITHLVSARRRSHDVVTGELAHIAKGMPRVPTGPARGVKPMTYEGDM